MRGRGMLIVGLSAVAILLVQALTAISAVIIADRGTNAAARDTYSYVGDVMSERVDALLGAAEDVVRVFIFIYLFILFYFILFIYLFFSQVSPVL